MSFLTIFMGMLMETFKSNTCNERDSSCLVFFRSKTLGRVSPKPSGDPESRRFRQDAKPGTETSATDKTKIGSAYLASLSEQGVLPLVRRSTKIGAHGKKGEDEKVPQTRLGFQVAAVIARNNSLTKGETRHGPKRRDPSRNRPSGNVITKSVTRENNRVRLLSVSGGSIAPTSRPSLTHSQGKPDWK